MSRGTKVTLLDGQERILRYDLNAIAEVGERLNIKIRLGHLRDDLMEVPLELGALRTILWAGVLHDTPDADEREIGKLVDLESLPEVVTDFFSQFTVTSAVAVSAMATVERENSNSSREEDPAPTT